MTEAEQQSCEACAGTGAVEGTLCITCGGVGYIEVLPDEVKGDPVHDHALRAKLRNVGRERKDLLERIAVAESRYELLSGLVRQGNHPVSIFEREKRSRVHEGTAILTCSDWHVEEQVDPEEVNGLNAYNLDIAAARVQRLTDGFLWLHALHNGPKYRIRDVVIAFLGDMVSGWIHPELAATNALAPPPAILFFEDLARKMLKTILTETNVTVHLICTAGNHGRLTQKKQVKKKGLTSIEWVAYGSLARWLRESGHGEWRDRVKIHIARGAMVYLDVYERYKLRFIHGDQIGYQGGIGGVTIPLNKKLLRWNGKLDAHCTYLGHFHQYHPGSRYQMNGSLIGYSEYADWIAGEYEPPIQSFSLIDSRYGRTGVWPVHCSEQRQPGYDPRIDPYPGSAPERETRRQQRTYGRARAGADVPLVIDGVSKIRSEWAEVAKTHGVAKTTFYDRLRAGWDPKEALTTPPRKTGFSKGRGTRSQDKPKPKA